MFFLVAATLLTFQSPVAYGQDAKQHHFLRFENFFQVERNTFFSSIYQQNTFVERHDSQPPEQNTIYNNLFNKIVDIKALCHNAPQKGGIIHGFQVS